MVLTFLWKKVMAWQILLLVTIISQNKVITGLFEQEDVKDVVKNKNIFAISQNVSHTIASLNNKRDKV